MWLVDREQMRNIDHFMMEKVGINGLALMEVAGSAVARSCIDCARNIGKKGWLSVHVVAGKGHNGADGFVAARYLLAQGHHVLVWVTSEASQLSAACKKQMQAYLALGGQLAQSDDDLAKADVIIDAILGTGSRLPLQESLRPFARAIRESGRPVVAVDIPSGLDASTGQVDPDVILASVTVTLGYAKMGLYQYPGKDFVGKVVLESLSMPDDLAVDHGAYAIALKDDEWLHMRMRRDQNSHKGTFGKAGVVAGSQGMLGAARMALEAAYRAGAGLVEWFCSLDTPDSFWTTLPAEILVHLYEGKSGEWQDHVISHLLEWSKGQTALLLGPGMGHGIKRLASTQPEALLRLSEIPLPMVLDADFLHALSLMPDQGREWYATRRHSTIITPHPKEFARLVEMDTAAVQQNRVWHARSYSTKHQVIVVLKGAGTVTALPDGRVYINTSGNSGLATGGSGDILAGYLTGLLASGYPAEIAAPLGVYLHGKAADLARDAGNCEESLMASDLLSWLSRAYSPLFPTGN